MFLNTFDYGTLILDEDITLINQTNQLNRDAAELMAVDQVSGYLRSKYDVAAIFALAGANRPKYLVMIVVDIALYHLHASIPGRFVPEIRRTRYEDAIAWLEKVAKGLVDPGLTLKTDPDTGEAITAPSITFGSQEKMNNTW